MSFYIGIDLGTSSVKAVLISETGEIIKNESIVYKTISDETGLSEIDPEIWFESTVKCLENLTKDEKNISAIGVTGQMHSLAMLDSYGDVVRPVIMWNDLRALDQASRIRKVAEDYGLYSISKIASTGSPAANLLFVRENEPDIFKRISKILIGHDYLGYRLTGHVGADLCEASTSALYDLKNRRWSPEILDYIGIDEFVMPEIVPSCCCVGKLRDEICCRLGLDGAPDVAEGTGDNVASVLSLDTPCVSLGTSGVYIEKRREVVEERKGKDILYSAKGEEPTVIVQGVVQSVGSTLTWLKDTLLMKNVPTMLSGILEKIEDELLFYPHLNGDKTLYADSSLRGALFGISLNTGRGDIVTAVIEGICFALCQMISEVALEEREMITLTGGLSGSWRFVRTLSNVLEREVKVVKDNPGAVYGAALMAMEMNDIPKPKKFVSNTIFRPDRNRQGYYRRKYDKYLKIHNCLPR